MGSHPSKNEFSAGIRAGGLVTIDPNVSPPFTKLVASGTTTTAIGASLGTINLADNQTVRVNAAGTEYEDTGASTQVANIAVTVDHALRNCFITVADRELMLPTSLTKRLVNHARPRDVTEGYAADWTMDQLRDAAQKVADRIDALIASGAPAHEVPHPAA